MPKYLVQGSYTVEGVKGLIRDGGSGRRKAIEAVVGGLGGEVEALYYAFGENDIYLIVDMPDAASMLAMSTAVAAAGGARIKTTPLLTIDEVDQAVKKAVNYRAPGQGH